MAIRCGAHSFPGYSSVDRGLVIDLGRVNQVRVDPQAKRARVQGGALIRDLDTATQRYGLAVPSGFVSHTGVTGPTLGGGMGWLNRQACLSIDNLVAADVVVADGSILRAAENENPDLFGRSVAGAAISVWSLSWSSGCTRSAPWEPVKSFV